MLTEELMREVRRLEVRARRRVDELFAGEYHSAFRGQGVEFAEVREYEPGDDVRSIDWNVTARTGRPFVKRYVEERQLSVVLVLDLSASTIFGSGGRPKARLMAEMSAVLALAASRNADRAGLMTFSDQIELYLPPRKGRTHVQRLIREVLDSEPRGRGRAMADAMVMLRRVLSRHSVVFLVSDFLDEDPASPDEPVWELPLRLLARRHDVTALRVTDPLEIDPPRLGLVELRDPETGRRVLADTSSRAVRRRHRTLMAESERRLEQRLGRAKVDLVRLSTDRPFVDDLHAYFRRREGRRRAG